MYPVLQQKGVCSVFYLKPLLAVREYTEITYIKISISWYIFVPPGSPKFLLTEKEVAEKSETSKACRHSASAEMLWEKASLLHLPKKENLEVLEDIHRNVCRKMKIGKLVKSSQSWQSFHTQRGSSASAREFSKQQTWTPLKPNKMGNGSIGIQNLFLLTSSKDPDG